MSSGLSNELIVMNPESFDLFNNLLINEKNMLEEYLEKVRLASKGITEKEWKCFGSAAGYECSSIVIRITNECAENFIFLSNILRQVKLEIEAADSMGAN